MNYVRAETEMGLSDAVRRGLRGSSATASATANPGYDPKTHYEIERELAHRLLRSSREERSTLYRSLYDELFQRVPQHPQLTAKDGGEHRNAEIAYLMYSLAPFLTPKTVYAEIGAGDCLLSMSIAAYVQKVYAVDVSSEITKNLSPPGNFELRLSDGISVPVEKADFVLSNQLMEHLHPQDALDQLRNIYNSLAPGGRYLCITPNRINGPHDVSRFFEPVAKGFHLKEYDVRELASMFLKAGFSGVKIYFRMRSIRTFLPVSVAAFLERAMMCMPYEARKRVGQIRGIKHLLGIQLLGMK